MVRIGGFKEDETRIADKSRSLAVSGRALGVAEDVVEGVIKGRSRGRCDAAVHARHDDIAKDGIFIEVQADADAVARGGGADLDAVKSVAKFNGRRRLDAVSCTGSIEG